MYDKQKTTQKKSSMPQDNSSSPPKTPASSMKAGMSSPAGKAMPMKPGFYLVATPIGNLRDITFRALDVLSSVDLIICEDTRVTGKLMNAYGFKKKMQVYNDHSTDHQRERLIEAVANGQSIAVLSDAGTPLVSDPGYKLVRNAVAEGLYVTSIPGPNAALPALQLSGLPTDQFCFLGFLPPKTTARQNALKKWEASPGSLIIYETGPRLVDSLQDMRIALGNREAAVMRELTKMYEEVRRGTLSELILHYGEKGAPKGEIVVVLGHAVAEVMSSESIEKQLIKALEKMSVRDAAEVVAQTTGKPKKTIYTLALKLASGTK
jgi:16S rRNA (cytidine1402-2'-O)-methyltransferase